MSLLFAYDKIGFPQDEAKMRILISAPETVPSRETINRYKALSLKDYNVLERFGISDDVRRDRTENYCIQLPFSQEDGVTFSEVRMKAHPHYVWDQT